MNAGAEALCCSCVLWLVDSKSSHLEAAGGSHLDREEMMAVLLKLMARGVLGEKQPGEILEAAD